MTQKPDAVELMTDAELDTAVEVAKSAEVDEYVKTLQWSDDIDDYTKTLIIGNIRGFAFRKTTPSLGVPYPNHTPPTADRRVSDES